MRTKIINIAAHVAGWLFFFSLIVGFFANSPEGEKNIFGQLFKAPFLIFYLTFLFLFYINYFLLVPALYLKKYYLLYILAIVILFASVYLIKPFDRLMHINPPPDHAGMKDDGFRRADEPPKRAPSNRDFTSVILFFSVWSVSTAIPLVRRYRATEKRMLEAEADRANAELSFLKSQVNPHFLFNTLNNIYSMAITKNENTAPSIMMLSNIMRYVTDEVGADYVGLDSEIACMKDYIDLQRMRLDEKISIQFGISGNTTDKKIAPLLLMTFVENVFKYGISSHEPSEIIIKLNADLHSITFYCQNRIFDNKRNSERTGIGIPNAKQRLQHLYPDKHFLNINNDNEMFTVQLTIQA